MRSLQLPSLSPVRYAPSQNNLLRNLRAWWLAVPGHNGYGSTKWLDISRWNEHGTLVSMSPTTDWKSVSPWYQGNWGSLDFDGTNDIVQTSAFDFEPPYTVAGWFRLVDATPATDDVIISDYNSAGNAVQCDIRVTTTGTFDLFFQNGGYVQAQVAAGSISDNTWHHFIISQTDLTFLDRDWETCQ